MISFKVLFCVIVLVDGILSSNDGNCKIDEETVSWDKVNRVGTVDDDVVANYVVTSFKYIEVPDSVSIENDKYGYLKINVDPTKTSIIIVTTDNVKNIDEDNETTERLDIQFNVVFNCGGTKNSTMRFDLTVNDKNTYPPKFDSSSYTYLVPMPMSSKVDIVLFGQVPWVTDLDFTNMNIALSVDPPELDVEVSPRQLKSYYVSIKFTENVRLTKNKTYTLTATDTGVPPKKSEPIQLFIEIDGAISALEPPSFTKASYQFKYDPHLKSIEPETPVQLSTSYGDKLELKIDGEYSEYFETPKLENEIVEITLKAGGLPIDKILDPFIIVTLMVWPEDKEDSAGKADIITLLPADSTPSFTKPSYSFTYDSESKNIKTETPVQLDRSTGEKLILKIDGKYSEYFDTPKIAENVIEITLKAEGLPIDKIPDLFIIVTLSVWPEDREDSVGKADILTLLPRDSTLSFTKPSYSFTYDSESKNITTETPVQLDRSTEEKLILKIDGKYSEYFETPKLAEKEILEITLKAGGLPLNKILDPLIIVTLSVWPEDREDSVRKADIITFLPADSTPSFTKLWYSFTYDSVSKNIRTETPVQLDRLTEEKLILKIDGKYSEYFETPKLVEKDLVEITLKAGGLPIDKIPDPFIIVTLSVWPEDREDSVGKADILTLLPADSTPSFTKPSYSFTYDFESKNIKTETPVQLDRSTEENLILKIDGKYSEYFETPKLAQKEIVEITLKAEGLPIDKIQDPFIIVTLSMWPENREDSVEKADIITLLPADSTPSFTKPSYSFTYVADSKSIETETPVQLDRSTEETLILKIDGKYGEYFETPKLDENETVLITLKAGGLPIDKILDPFIIVTLSVWPEDREDSVGKADIITLLPTDSTTLSFTKPSYLFTYDSESKNIKTETPVQLDRTTEEKLILKIDGKYDEYFETPKLADNQIVVITLKAGGLPIDKILDPFIIVTLSVWPEDRKDSVGKADIITLLPTDSTTLSFTKPSYSFTYDSVSKNIKTDTPVQLDRTTEENLILKIDGKYGEYFEIPKLADNQIVVITLKAGGLPIDKILDPFIIVTLSVWPEDREDSVGKADIITLLPTDSTTLSFTKPSYSFTYDSESKNIKTETPVQLDRTTEENLILKIDGKYGEYFETPKLADNEIVVITLKAGGLPIDKILDPFIIVTLSVWPEDREDSVGKADIITLLPADSTTLSFTKPSYSFTYDSESKNIKTETPVQLDRTTEENLILKIDGKYNECFETPTLTGTEISITLKSDCSEFDEIPNPFIVVTLTASPENRGDVVGKAAIIISMPSSGDLDTSFTSPVYLADYDVAAQSITMAEFISVTQHSDIVQFETNNTEKFTIIQVAGSSGHWTIKPNEPLDENDLDDKFLYLLVSVFFDFQNPSDQASVVITLPNGKTPVHFQEPVIEANYTIDGTHNLIGSIPKLSSNYVKVNSAKLSGAHNEYFKISTDLKITIEKDLPEDIYDKLNVIHLNIEVNLQMEDEVTVTSGLLIFLPRNFNGGTGGNSNDGDDNSGTTTGLIVGIAIISTLLIGYIIATIIFYMKRIRPARMLKTDQEVKTKSEKLSYSKKLSKDSTYKNVNTRRPTGYIRYNPNLLDDIEEDVDNSKQEAPSEKFSKLPGNDSSENIPRFTFIKSEGPAVEESDDIPGVPAENILNLEEDAPNMQVSLESTLPRKNVAFNLNDQISDDLDDENYTAPFDSVDNEPTYDQKPEVSGNDTSKSEETSHIYDLIDTPSPPYREKSVVFNDTVQISDDSI